MATHITQIGKHKFICGLFWQSLSRPRELQREATELARKIDADLLVLRKDNSMAQAGYASSKDGARRGMFSLAAIVSKTLAVEGAHYDGRKQPVHNWLAAFRLPDDVWAYFAVRDANFLPNGDFAGTREEVLERLHGDYGLGGWNLVIGDPELAEQGFHNFSAKRVEDLLPRNKKGLVRIHGWSSLTQVEYGVRWKPLIAIGVAGALIGGGGFAYWKYDQHRKAEAERARALEAERQRMLGNEAPTILPHPWPTKPLPLPTAQACLEKMDLIAPGGWSLDEYVCSGTEVRYLWSRNGSTIDYLLAQVPDAMVEVSGNKASYTEALQLDTGKDEALLDTRKVLQPLLSRLQLLGVDARVTNVPALQQAASAGGQRPPAVPDWQTYSITMNTGGMPPTEVATVLTQPGVRLEKLAYREGAWSIEGVIYAK